MAGEHQWADEESGEKKFIDLILGYNSHKKIRMVIECKRVKEASWVFLLPEGSQKKIRDTRLLDIEAPDPEVKTLIFWNDWEINPESYQSEYCVLRGQDEDRPLLERISGVLLNSLEALAEEELVLSSKNQGIDKNAIYLPVIVTNANLSACRFDPGNVDIKSGQLPTGEFESVPFIRFRKTTATKYSAHTGSTISRHLSKA